MKQYKWSFSDIELDVVIHMISFGQMEILRQMKRLSHCDFDLKEYYYHYRVISNQIKSKLTAMRGY